MSVGQQRSSTPSQQDSMTARQQHALTPAHLHSCSTSFLDHCTTAPLHDCTTAPLYHCTTAPCTMLLPPAASFVLWLATRCACCPFDCPALQPWPVAVFLRVGCASAGRHGPRGLLATVSAWRVEVSVRGRALRGSYLPDRETPCTLPHRLRPVLVVPVLLQRGRRHTSAAAPRQRGYFLTFSRCRAKMRVALQMVIFVHGPYFGLS